ncbi:MAG: PAS domain S-box protein [Bacteroidetes bacterium]|nr:PAS domain S-box protein [Bacteroidota bacterium]
MTKPLFTQDQFLSLLSLINDFVFIMDEDKRFVMCFQPEGELFAPYDSFIGKNLQEINFPKAAVADIMKTMDEVFETGITGTVEYSIMMNGFLKWFSATISRIDNLQNGKPGFFSVVRNITEMKQYQTMLENQNKHLKDVAFLHSNVIKHQLKSVEKLAAISENGNLSSSSQEYAELIKEAAIELQNILKKLSINAESILSN